MLKTREVYYRKAFEVSLEQRLIYIKELFGASYANKFSLALEHFLHTLAIFPEMGMKNIRGENYRQIVFKQNFIVYSFDEEKVVLIKMIHGRQVKNTKSL